MSTATLVPFVLAAGCVFAAPLYAQGILYDVQSRPHHVSTRPTPRLVLERHEVRGRISESIAEYRVVQRFRNPAPHAIEGEYLCPIPRGATARGLALIIGGKRLEGEILDAANASAIYRDIVRRMKDPALLEYVDSGLLRASVFPVPANGTVDVEIDLVAAVDDLGSGLLEVALPLRHAVETNAHIFIDLEVATDHPLETIYSPTHQARIDRKGKNEARVVIDGARSGGDFRLYFAAASEPGGLRTIFHRAGNGDGYLMVLHEPLADPTLETAPRDVVFVVDRSGSMQGVKWEQAVKALRFGIGTLRERDRFAFLSFASDVRSEATKLRAATAEAKEQAIRHLESLSAGGGTNIADALASALPMIDSEPGRLPLIVFVTDGLPTVGEVAIDRILATASERNARRARIFAFGVGYDVNTVLLDRLATDTAADSSYVAPEQDLEIPLSAFFAKVSEPRLVSPRLELEGKGIEFFAMEPHVLPDLFAGDTLRAVFRCRGTGAARVVLTGSRGTAAVRIEREFELAATATKNEFLPGQWATRRIGHLLEEIRTHGANPELVDEVTALGKEHGIVTPYTAGLVVEDGAVAAESVRDSATSWDSDRGQVPRHPVGGGALKREFGGAPTAGKPAPSGPATPGAGEAAVRASNLEKKMKRGELEADAEATSGASLTKRIGNRLFRLESTTWVESTVTSEGRAAAIVLLAFSDEYFVFVRDHKDLANVFALGDDFVFVLDGKTYHVKPE
jgi:Ca-activated chloride channel homolog